MATGNLQNNWRQLQRSLQTIGYSKNLIQALKLKDFEGCGWLAIVHYCLLDYSPLIANTLSQSGFYDLNGKKDGKFIHLLYRLLTELYCYVPSLRKDQMLMSGFVERKILFVIDLIKLVQQHHLALRKNRPFDARKSLSSSLPTIQLITKNSRTSDVSSSNLPLPQFPQVSVNNLVSDAGENGNGQPANENNSQSISNINRPAVNLLDERRRRLKEFQDSIERPTAPAALSLMPHDTTTNLYFAVADETENPKSESCVSQWIHSVDHLFANSSEEHLATIQMNDNADWQTETAQCLEIPVDRQEDDDPADDESDIIDHYTVETAEQNKPSVDAAKEISAAIDVTDQNTNHLIQRLAGQVQMMTTAMQKLMERVETTEKLIHLQ